jgi:hypothetical protein
MYEQCGSTKIPVSAFPVLSVETANASKAI